MRFTILCALLTAVFAAHYAFAEPAYRIGVGKSDITGPAAGIQMFGFVRDDQITAGIHTRLWSRAFVIANASGDGRLLFVVPDLGSVPHEMQLAVIQRLTARYGQTYTLDNTIISATHTHAGPGGYWPSSEDSPLAGRFYQDHFDAIVEGIVASAAQAHESLAPGDIYINRGDVEGAGANRSMPAYLNNPEDERARYEHDTDRTMTLLKLVTDDGVIGVLNWFAVHPTSMTYYNRLISGDHKGHAEQLFEALAANGDNYAENFTAAFANTNCGDVTPNLNLDNTGPGADEFESTRIIAERQFRRAAELADTATEKLYGPVASIHAYVDFSNLEVRDEFTGAGVQHTCPSAYGYAFAAGSTEDGGGHPLFREGMTQRDPLIDATVKAQLGVPEPSDALRACHLPKAILFAPGEMDPPAQSQVLPLTLARVGQLAILGVPGEITTMAGRRLRTSVRAALGKTDTPVVIAAYSNHYCGYITTKEEYDTQQYEGGHTLFGPWTLAGMQQEFARLAEAFVRGERVERGPQPLVVMDGAKSTPIGTPFDATPAGAAFGHVIEDAGEQYRPGDRVSATFWSAHPQNAFRTGNNYVRIERETNGSWDVVATDDAWATRFHWTATEDTEGGSHAAIHWDIPGDTPSGRYRIVHQSAWKDAAGAVSAFEGTSSAFEVVR